MLPIKKPPDQTQNQKQIPPVQQAPLCTTPAGANYRRLQKSKRYKALLGKQWNDLPEAIQRRFVNWTPPSSLQIYKGHVLETRLTLFGRLAVRLTNFIGLPIPIASEDKAGAIILVREACGFEGQFWSRIYNRTNSPPHMINSTKCFAGKTGLEELVNCWFGISLSLFAENDSLVFSSEQYFLKILQKRCYLPRWLIPVYLRVTHADRGPHRFRFTLEISIPVIGEIINQTAIFEELAQ